MATQQLLPALSSELGLILTCLTLSLSLSFSLSLHLPHPLHLSDALISVICRRRIKTEKTTKFVAAVWGTEFIQFLATLVILHLYDLEE